MVVTNRFILFFYFLFIGCVAFSQNRNWSVSETPPDFTDLTASWVQATYGSVYFPFTNKGIIPGRHTLITQGGKDPLTGNRLDLLPPGESKVIRLGNCEVGAEAESITYRFKVDQHKSVLMIKFAVVFEDPGHPAENQPRFVVRIMNKNSELIDLCALYDVSARPDIEGFQTYEHYGAPIRWRDWTSVGLDLSQYVREEIQVQFITYDCEWNGHFGYAYFTASCISNQLSLDACNSNEITLSAPEGFGSYLWHNGATTPTTMWSLDGNATSVSCELTSVTGCRFTLNGFISTDNNLPTENQTIHDVICKGDIYTDHFFDLPPQQQTGTFVHYNTFFNPVSCYGNITTTLFLTVQEKYYSLEEHICQGESYNKNNFDLHQPSVGIHYDTLIFNSAADCDSVVALKLTVNSNFVLPDIPLGDRHPCSGNAVIYSIPDPDPYTRYEWEVPEGYYILRGQGSSSISVQITDQALTGEITYKASNGCGNGQIPFIVEPYLSYWQTLTDSICTGESYHKKGFHIPIRDSASFSTWIENYKTQRGCDSVITLHLYTFETPSIQIAVKDSILCEHTEITLHALHKDTPLSKKLPASIGDILCQDGTIVTPENYSADQHTAEGIVFWVTPDGQHGWAVHPTDQSTGCLWAQKNAPIPDLQSLTSYLWARSDTAGYTHTATIMATGNADLFPAAWNAKLNDSWYLPAMGQLNLLFAAIPEINPSLSLVHGTPFDFESGTEWRYWSSSLNIGYKIGPSLDRIFYPWGIFYNGEVSSLDLVVTCRVRAIRSF